MYIYTHVNIAFPHISNHLFWLLTDIGWLKLDSNFMDWFIYYEIDICEWWWMYNSRTNHLASQENPIQSPLKTSVKRFRTLPAEENTMP